MGHLFRAMHLARVIEKSGEAPFILINDYSPALQILARSGIPHGVVDLSNLDMDWEGRFIRTHGVSTWINDRLDTDARHAAKVKERSSPLVTFDDRGAGAAAADLHIAALAFDPKERLGGTRVLRGVDYLVLDPGIARYRRLRTGRLRTLVTMGGTDTYGLTATVAQHLREAGRVATVVTGPDTAII
jgi:spore coat polysaccharide biosynthesis predicted glycosyltransferase SpsG